MTQPSSAIPPATTEPPAYTVPMITSVQAMIVRSGKVFGDKLALEDLKETPLPRVSYASLLSNVMKFGKALKALGLPERSHIAVIGENRVQWAVAYLACMTFNYVVVPIDRNLTVNEILTIIHESDAVAIVYSEQFHPILRERRSSLRNLKHYISMDLPAERDGAHSMMNMISRQPEVHPESLPHVDAHAMAAILFTSGSLGRAKAVMLSQFNIASNLMAMTTALKVYPEDRFLSVLPIHHTYECTCGFLCPLYMGSSIHYAQSLKTVVDDLQASRATMLLAVPLLYDKMYKRISKAISEKKVKAAIVPPLVKVTGALEKVGIKGIKKSVFSEIHNRFGGHIRLFIAGGAAPDPMVSKGLREFGFNFLQGYGLTETSPILTLNHIDNFKDDSAGLPLPGVTLRIDNPNEEGVGEIWAKGPNIMIGYYENEEATKAAFEDGWFKTGDLGYIDRDGFLHICGRQKNVIISKGGKNVYPEEIEDLLIRSRYIMEAVVYGQHDRSQGEIIAAQIVVDAEAFIEYAESRGVEITEQLMRDVIGREIEQVNSQLAQFKQIRRYSLRDKEFEKTTTQKVKRYLLRTE